jgi:Protein of unknown function (DUF4231)
MSTSTTTRPTVTGHATADDADSDTDRRATAYRRRVELLRHRYQRRARRYSVCANGVSLLLVAAGAGIGVTALDPSFSVWTVVLGALVVLLEGVTRVLRPSLRAGRARRTARALDREFRLYDAHGRGYRGGEQDAEAAFVNAVERILDHASAEEDRDDTGSGSDATPAEPLPRRSLRTA